MRTKLKTSFLSLGVTSKVFVVDLEADTIANPISLRSYVSTTVQEFRTQIAEVSFEEPRVLK